MSNVEPAPVRVAVGFLPTPGGMSASLGFQF
jgi:hypothetical protein